MNHSFKPDGYPQVSPYLMVTGAEAVVAFLRSAFGGAVLRRFDGPDGRIEHVEVKIGDSVIMLSEGSGAFPPFPAWIHLYLPDVRSSYQKALAAGGVAVQAPVQKEGDPDLRGGVQDPSGNTWWISTQIGES